MISLQDARSRAAFTLLVLESLIPSAVPKNSYWQKLFPRPLLQLVTLKSQLGAVQRSSWSFWKRGSSGASRVVLDGSGHARLLQSQLGDLTTLGTLPSMGITSMMLWWLTSAEETSKGVNQQPAYPITPMLPEFLSQQSATTDCSVSIKKQRMFGLCLWPSQRLTPWQIF